MEERLTKQQIQSTVNHDIDISPDSPFAEQIRQIVAQAVRQVALQLEGRQYTEEEMMDIARKAITVDFLKSSFGHLYLITPKVCGDYSRLKIAKDTNFNNCLFNLMSGNIEIGECSFAGHNVSLITGTHRYTAKMEGRFSFPESGRDIIIGKGVWIGSSVTILGPCTIHDHAVIASGAVVIPGTEVPEGTIYGGVPAKFIKEIEFSEP